MTYSLNIISGPDAGKNYILKQGENVLGTSEKDADFCLSDGGISHKHCRIMLNDNILVLVDLNSKNGTKVNDVKVTQAELIPEDRITLSNTIICLKDDSEGHTMDDSKSIVMKGAKEYTHNASIASNPHTITANDSAEKWSDYTNDGIVRTYSLKDNDNTLPETGNSTYTETNNICPTCVCGENKISPSTMQTGATLSSNSEETDAPTQNHTKTGKTVAISENLREQIEENRDIIIRRRRMWRLAGLSLLLVILCLTLFFLREKQHETIKPGNVKSMSIAAFAEVDDTGRAKLFSIVYPASAESSSTHDVGKGYHEITTFIGRKHKIVLHVKLSRKMSAEFLQEDIVDGMFSACRQLDKNIVLLDRSPATLFFFPKDNDEAAPNGLRYVSSPYVRVNKEAHGMQGYYGVLYFFRQADTNYILQAEVDDAARDLTATFLDEYQFLAFDNADFIRKHWEGSAELKDTEDDLATFRANFNLRQDSKLFPAYETQLKRFMLTYLKSEDTIRFEESYNLFLELRKLQKMFYNKLRIRYQRISGTNREAEKERLAIRGEAEQAFMHQDDARYRKIRQNNWHWLSEEEKKDSEAKKGKEKKKSR